MQTAAKGRISAPLKVKGFGAGNDPVFGKTLRPFQFERRRLLPDEVLLEVHYCGVCSSDVRLVDNVRNNTLYPCIPGHEILGIITETGTQAGEFKKGDMVGLGCMIDSCRKCSYCITGEEQFCEGPAGMTMTCNGFGKQGAFAFNTYGGLSSHVIANKAFVLSIPRVLRQPGAAPILCSGVAAYTPLKKAGLRPGQKTGIIGTAGAGHMGILIAKAMGSYVVAFATNETMRIAALSLGADEVVIAGCTEDMKKHTGSFDFMLYTLAGASDVSRYLPLLTLQGCILAAGLPGPGGLKTSTYACSLAATFAGSVSETQEAINFCAEHDVLPEVQIIDIRDINKVFDRIRQDEGKFIYVIDMKALR